MTNGESARPVQYEGFEIGVDCRRFLDDAGMPTYACHLVAAEIGSQPDALRFERTLTLSEADATMRNVVRPGVLPPREQLDAALEKAGVRYMQMLIAAVNRGFRTIGPNATLAVSEADSRIGMTDVALNSRER